MITIELELIRRCQQGDDESWRELFSKTYPLSRWVVMHTIFSATPQVVDEISQETMVALASSIGKIEDETHLRRFVKRVTRNKCINFIKRNREQFEDVPDDIPDDRDGPIVERPVVETLHEAVTELKEPCHTIIRGRFLSNLSYKEIVGKTGIDIKQIGIRINRCLATLKNIMEYKHVSLEDVP